LAGGRGGGISMKTGRNRSYVGGRGAHGYGGVRRIGGIWGKIKNLEKVFGKREIVEFLLQFIDFLIPNVHGDSSELTFDTIL
jgi:hypothetical protein